MTSETVGWDIQKRLRLRIREAIEVVLEEELDEALGCGAYERSSARRGYRNGSPVRGITTGVGYSGSGFLGGVCSARRGV